MTAMLTELRLDDWKSFGSGDGARNVIKLAPVTLLVGPNGSGKSNVLDALRFLQGAAQGMSLADVLRGRWEGSREVWPGIRGHIVEAARHGKTAVGLSCRLDLGDMKLDYALRVRLAGDVQVAAESLWEDENEDADFFYQQLVFDTHWRPKGESSRRITGGNISAWLGSQRDYEVMDVYSSMRSLLTQIPSYPDQSFRSYCLERVSKVQQSWVEAVSLEIRPSMMRDYRPDIGGPLGTSGENISSVLSSLSAEQLQDVVDWLSELCAPPLEQIDFDRTRLREVMMCLVERGGARISARSASDGTLRFLGLVVALLTCPKGSLILLEEPDVGLHPSRIRLLAELLERTAARRNIQILATTHSPTLLAHLSEDTLGSVVAFGRDAETGWTACSTLRDLPHFETLRESKNLEHLISTGWLERAL